MTRRKPWHPSNPYPRARKALADRPLYPFADRASALRIVAESTLEAAAAAEAERAARSEARRRARLGLAPKGAGKTAHVSRNIKEGRAEGKRVVFVVPSKGTRRKR